MIRPIRWTPFLVLALIATIAVTFTTLADGEEKATRLPMTSMVISGETYSAPEYAFLSVPYDGEDDRVMVEQGTDANVARSYWLIEVQEGSVLILPVRAKGKFLVRAGGGACVWPRDCEPVRVDSVPMGKRRAVR